MRTASVTYSLTALCNLPVALLSTQLFLLQPKFLTKAERAALALQRRQEETAGMRAQQDEMRRMQRAQQQVRATC